MSVPLLDPSIGSSDSAHVDENFVSSASGNPVDDRVHLDQENVSSGVTGYANVVAGGTSVDVPISGDQFVYNSLGQALTDFERENFNPENVVPERPCSAYFNTREYLSSKDIFEAFRRDGIPVDKVRCIQRKFSGDVLATFSSRAVRDQFLAVMSFCVNRRSYFVRSASKPYMFLTIYDAPTTCRTQLLRPDYHLIVQLFIRGGVDFKLILTFLMAFAIIKWNFIARLRGSCVSDVFWCTFITISNQEFVGNVGQGSIWPRIIPHKLFVSIATSLGMCPRNVLMTLLVVFAEV